MMLSVESDVAVTYYNIRQTDQELQILSNTIDTLHGRQTESRCGTGAGCIQTVIGAV
ncbi:hypothetical protein [Terriglobus albidus]|uniref:hypothetical protein n=1 Tax=Terriglobus albidus TaxID=1592106 RepID=UPI0021E0A769|nr:hypothetical protein [Terriglobus albidus]